jgi:uncharacterized repeat protein (TIGR01451 family)
MSIIKKLLGLSAMAGMLAVLAIPLLAERIVDEGKNFTVSNSPETTVFNLKTPSINRHIHEYNKPVRVAEPAPVADCEYGTVFDRVDKYLVQLEKTAPTVVALNAPYSYNYTVLAKQPVKQVVVEEQIPVGSVYVSSDPQAELDGDSVRWTLYNLEAGEAVPLVLVVRPTAVADLSSCATIVAYPQACTTTSVGVPELAIVKTTPNEQVFINAGVPWNITVTNAGNYCAYDVVVTDTLSAGLTHESGNRKLVTELGTLAPGESREISIDSTAILAGEHCNVAVVDASNAASVQDEACVSVVEAGLEVSKAGPAKQFVNKKASYQITAKNTGDVALRDVVVTDTVPAQARLLAAPGAQVDGNIATWTTRLDAGESKSFNLTVLGLQRGTYCNQVRAVSAAYGVSDSDDACTEWAGHPALLIEVIDTKDPLLIGEETTYVLQITNQGTAPDTNVALNIQLPANLTVVSATGDTKGTIAGNRVTFAPYRVLDPKEIIQFRVVAKAVAVGDARFEAQVSSDLLKAPVPEEEATQVY